MVYSLTLRSGCIKQFATERRVKRNVIACFLIGINDDSVYPSSRNSHFTRFQRTFW